MTTMFTDRAPGATAGARSLLTRNNLLLAAGLSLAGLGLAAGLVLRPAPVEPLPTSTATTRASLAANESLIERSAKPVTLMAQTPQQGAPAAPHAVPAVNETVVAQGPASTHKPVAVCAHCGVVQSVHAVKKKGQGTGVGAVAGGVVGGVVGNQFGHGNGRAAMTVLGAVGGGMAGHEIEKRSRSVTVYQVTVKMDDGSLRSFEQAVAPAVGARVVAEGNKLRLTKTRAQASGARA